MTVHKRKIRKIIVLARIVSATPLKIKKCGDVLQRNRLAETKPNYSHIRPREREKGKERKKEKRELETKGKN